MVFNSLIMTENGVVTAKAEGHGTDVLRVFHAVCVLLLGARGPWRIVEVNGWCPEDMQLDSDMQWKLTAQTKSVRI